jgi:hypothetical protein
MCPWFIVHVVPFFVRVHAHLQQKWELEDLKKEWRRKIGLKQTMFVKQQQAELDAFRLRVVAGHEKQKRLRQVRLNKYALVLLESRVSAGAVVDSPGSGSLSGS